MGYTPRDEMLSCLFQIIQIISEKTRTTNSISLRMFSNRNGLLSDPFLIHFYSETHEIGRLLLFRQQLLVSYCVNERRIPFFDKRKRSFRKGC